MFRTKPRHNAEVLVHLPRVSFDDGPVEFLWGELTSPTPSELREIDSDWIRETFVEKSIPTFWVCDKIAIEDDDDEYPLIEKSQRLVDYLLYELIAETGAELVSCKHSTSYLKASDGSWRTRLVGQFGRNHINHNPKPIVFSKDYAKEVEPQVLYWHEMLDVRGQDRSVLSGFDVLDGVSLSSQFPSFKCLPIMVALENVLIPDVRSGIQSALQTKVEEILGGELDEMTKNAIKSAYNLRSRIIHGEPIKALVHEGSREIYFGMRSLYARVLLAQAFNRLGPLDSLEGGK